MIVADAIANLDVFFDEKLSRSERRAAVTSFMESASLAFPKDTRTDTFARLGTAPDAMDPRQTIFVRTAYAASRAPQLVANPFGHGWANASSIICDCNVAAQDCAGQECDSGASNCGLTEEGCGPMNLFSCDGLCTGRVNMNDRKRAI
jgi:hypothetical protein